jgi:hypothetical protein
LRGFGCASIELDRAAEWVVLLRALRGFAPSE